jgi:protein transport protein SEC24
MLPVVNEIGELYNTADGGAMATLIAKLAIEKSYQSKLEETRNAIQVPPPLPPISILL